MSDETRAKMSQAKTNRTVPKDVRRKMSASHQGKKHSAETASLLSSKLRGRAKSPAHRMAIAAAQRKRHAAARVLKAVEDVHRQSQAEGVCSARRFQFMLTIQQRHCTCVVRQLSRRATVYGVKSSCC